MVLFLCDDIERKRVLSVALEKPPTHNCYKVVLDEVGRTQNVQTGFVANPRK